VRGADFLSIFETPQREALAMLFLNLHFHGLVVAEIFWGLWLFPLGLLVYRSRFLPRFLGVRLVIDGFAYVILSLTVARNITTRCLPTLSPPSSGRLRSCCGSSSKAPRRLRWPPHPHPPPLVRRTPGASGRPTCHPEHRKGPAFSPIFGFVPNPRRGATT
jgi:hypothetical protein